MRVSFEHYEVQKGLIFGKTYAGVTVTVGFSEEERYVIQQQRLQKHIVLKREPDADVAHRFRNDGGSLQSLVDAGNFDLTVKKLVNGPDRYVCRTNADAKAYEAELIEALKNMKSFLGAAGTKAESKTIEL